MVLNEPQYIAYMIHILATSEMVVDVRLLIQHSSGRW